MRKLKHPPSFFGIVVALLAMLTSIAGSFYLNAHGSVHAVGTSSIPGYGTVSAKYLYEGESADLVEPVWERHSGQALQH